MVDREPVGAHVELAVPAASTPDHVPNVIASEERGLRAGGRGGCRGGAAGGGGWR